MKKINTKDELQKLINQNIEKSSVNLMKDFKKRLKEFGNEEDPNKISPEGITAFIYMESQLFTKTAIYNVLADLLEIKDR